MDTYKLPLQISSYDPLCTANSMGNSIIGVLFDKKGLDIKNALLARVKTIDQKIKEYEGMVGKVEIFIEEKRKILKELDEFYLERSDKKEALLKPFRTELDDLRRKFNEQCNAINNKISQARGKFDKETYKSIGTKALSFEESFDDFKKNFLEVDEFLKREKNVIQGASGYNGVTGIQGQTGMEGIKDYLSPDSSGYTTSTSTGSSIYYNEPVKGIGFGDGDVGIGTNSPYALVNVTAAVKEKEDKAVARLESLRNLLIKYKAKIDLIKKRIQELDEERRRLSLIANNIEETREYRLDLNKLSAFGFEDVKIV